MKKQIYFEIVKDKKKERIEKLMDMGNIININKEKRDFFIYFNNYNYNAMFLIGQGRVIKDKVILQNIVDKVEIRINLESPSLYILLKL